jgi:histidinol-phosphatase (PHP family)
MDELRRRRIDILEDADQGESVSGSGVSDLHIHTEWSYDAPNGSMEDTCRRAAAHGIPSVAFTEHADYLPGVPTFDVVGYLGCVERCRARFPELRILTGVELGEAHRFRADVAALLETYPLDLVLGSIHCIPVGDRLVEIGDEGTLDADVASENVRRFFDETLDLVEQAPVFAALAHLDYPKRYWPHDVLRYSEQDYEEEYRAVLRAAAASGIALEINTDSGNLRHGPCPGPTVLRWWWDAGGSAVTFASDAHEPADIAAGFELAADIVEAAGFRPAARDFGRWRR